MFQLLLIFVLISLILVARNVFNKHMPPDIVPTKQYVAVKQTNIDGIYSGGTPVYFGPFSSIEQIYKWSDKNNLTVTIIELKNPDQWLLLKHSDRW